MPCRPSLAEGPILNLALSWAMFWAIPLEKRRSTEEQSTGFLLLIVSSWRSIDETRLRRELCCDKNDSEYVEIPGPALLLVPV